MRFPQSLGRRQVLAVLVGAAVVAPTRSMAECEVPATLFDPAPQAAVSLRALAEELKAERNPPRAPRPLGGLTRLDGYAIDRAGRDLLLWGQAEQGTPVLMLDDFLVGLRAAYGRYVEVRDGQRVRIMPGISIDADLRAFKALGEIEDLNSPAGTAEYERLCLQPMVLRVDGMPRHTRVSDILLAADYKMKLIVQGKAEIPIPMFFGSMNDRRFRMDEINARHGVQRADLGDIIRWWFRSGAFTVQRASGGSAAFLDRAQVILSVTHERIVDLNAVDSNVEDTPEDQYACDWSARMEETYLAEQLWREMGNVFRHFGVGQLISRDSALEASGMDPAPLLDGIPLHKVRIPDTVLGSVLFSRRQGENGPVSAHCGGVTLDVTERNLKASDAENSEAVATASRAILRDRPAGGAVFWRVG